MEYRELTESEYEDLKSRILYEDNHLLIINKKAGEITQGDKTGDEPLPDKYKSYIAMRDQKPGKVFLGIPHRLDRPVSGIVIFAKTSKALERLSEMFRNGKIHKIYWAICYNAPKIKEAELNDWIIRNEKSNKSFIVKGHSGINNDIKHAPLDKDAKLAQLKYRHLGDTERYHLIEIELLTGRHHQIRCQLSGIGCIIKGDLKYGAPRSNPDGGISLLSRYVKFIHPVKKTELCVKAPIPNSWKGIEAFED